jgi:hypothetical protein
LVATEGEEGSPDADDVDLYRLFQAAEILGCPPWLLAEQPSFWQEKAFWFFDVNKRAAEIARAIGEHREKAATGDGETGEDDDD